MVKSLAMKRLPFLLICLLTFVRAPARAAGWASEGLTNVAAVVAAVKDKQFGRHFELTARVRLPSGESATHSYPVSDASGHIVLRANQPVPVRDIRSGDLVRARGFIDLSQFSPACARLAEITRLAPGVPPKPTAVTGKDLTTGHYDEQFVTLEGCVRDAFFDDVDPNYGVLVLDTESEKVNVLFSAVGLAQTNLESLINARVAVEGLCLTSSPGSRKMNGRHINATGIDAIRVLDNAVGSLFDVQNLESLLTRSGEEISRMGRRRVFGKVIAAWGDNSFLVRYMNRDVVRVELARGRLPAYGEWVEAVGFPETDMYFVNLSRADWRPHGQPTTSDEPVQDVSPADILLDDMGRSKINIRYHGQAVRLRGKLLSVPSSDDRRLILECDGFNVPVDVSADPSLADGLSAGCQVSIAGICVMDIESWRPNAIFPRIKGFSVVPRTSRDITVLSRPSWWTPGRLTTALCALGALLVGILLWNTTLRRRVEKRSRELSQETVARVTSELKVGERTRLAMELHDSIVQSLTGVSMEIRTADRIADEDRAGMHGHLSLAVKTLDSCRKELRNCLWDLRNLTLEDEDVNDAIRRTLAPHVGNTELAVRFNVPRELFCDNTAHTILRIIRELAINAVQHGKATSVRVAGSIEGGKLLFSVRDNGCGFDPDTAPGMAQGHFGLQGIRDRIESFEGEMSVQSAPGKGAKVTIALTVPQGTEEVLS